MSVLILVYDNTSHIYEDDFRLYQEFRFDATEKEKIKPVFLRMDSELADKGKK